MRRGCEKLACRSDQGPSAACQWRTSESMAPWRVLIFRLWPLMGPALIRIRGPLAGAIRTLTHIARTCDFDPLRTSRPLPLRRNCPPPSAFRDRSMMRKKLDRLSRRTFSTQSAMSGSDGLGWARDTSPAGHRACAQVRSCASAFYVASVQALDEPALFQFINEGQICNIRLLQFLRRRIFFGKCIPYTLHPFR